MKKHLFDHVIHLKDNMSSDTSVLNSHVLNSGDVNYHDHSFYEICYIIDNSLPHFVNDCKMDLEPGDIVFLRPRDKHVYVRDKNCLSYHRDIIFHVGFFESVLNFLHPDLLETYNKSRLPFKTNLPPEEIERFEKKIAEYSLIPGDDTMAKLVFAKTLLIELLYYYNKPLSQTNTNYPPLVNQIIQKLNMHYVLKIGIPYIFSHFNYSKSHICNTFKKHMHISLTEYINKLRLNYAANLLKLTNNSLHYISQECGFSSLSYFNKLFKQHFNCTPAKYRNH